MLKKRAKRSFTGHWRILSDHDAIKHFQTLAYVRRVRLASGEIVEFDLGPVLEQACLIRTGFSETELEADN